MKKDPKINIVFILECIEHIEHYLDNVNFERFLDSDILQDAVIRRIELIGEAVKNLPQSLIDSYPDVPWKRIAGMRDVLIHDYLGIDLDTTWQVVQNEISSLKKLLIQIRNDIEKNK